MEADEKNTREDFSGMLKSGAFADATVTCGERTWKVHKFVVCQRSVWFSKALTGHFEEASSGVVKLQDLNAEHVDWVIKFLYAGNVDFLNPLLENVLTLHEACVNLYIIGDFFQLDHLTKASCRALRDHNRSIAPEIYHKYLDDKGRNASSFWDSEYRERFFLHAKAAFSGQFYKLQRAFNHLFQCTRFILLEDKAVYKCLENVPELGLMILRDRRKGLLAPLSKGAKCINCGRKPYQRSEGFVRMTELDPTEGNEAYIYTYCDQCYETEVTSEDEV